MYNIKNKKSVMLENERNIEEAKTNEGKILKNISNIKYDWASCNNQMGNKCNSYVYI